MTYTKSHRNTRTTTRTNATSYRTTPSWSPTQFRSIGRNIQQTIGSFRNIQTQFNGATKVTAFSPTSANKWIKYVNNGTYIYKFNHNEFCRFFGARFNNWTTPNSACRFLRNRFGAGIKDVTRGKGGCWLIAATPTVTARPFSTYKW